MLQRREASPETIVADHAAPAATALPSADLAFLSVAGGSAATLLLLFGLAVAADAVGLGLPGLAAALDPGRAGSLPDLWGIAWLAAAAGLALVVAARASDRSLLRLGLLPAVLGLVDTTDLAARLEPIAAALAGFSSGTTAAKLAADGLVSGLVLAAALAAAAGGTPSRPAGRNCLLAVLVAGGASVACDLAGRVGLWLVPLSTVTHGLEMIEEAVELGLYVWVAVLVLGATFRLSSSETVSDRYDFGGSCVRRP